jgi:hypothetical protein
MARKILVALGLTALVSLGSAAAASATTATVGELFNPTANCVGTYTYLQTGSSGGGGFVIPFNGVITSWTFQEGALTVNGLKLKVGHQAGSQFVIDAESPAGTQTPNAATPYPVNIPVQAGQYIGISQTGGGSCVGAAPGYTITGFTGDVPPGSTATPLGNAPGYRLPVQATVLQVTGQRAAALKKCKKKHSNRARKRCRKKAKKLPL